MLKRFIRIALAAGLALGFVTTASAAHWNMATPYPDSNFHTKNIYQFVDQIESATDLTISVHSGGSLIKHQQIKRATQTGQVQMGGVLVSVLGNENPIYAIDSIPFLATNYAQASKLWQAAEPVIEDLLAKRGLKLLYAVPWPPQGLYVSKPVDNVKDLKGLKFRSYNPTTSHLAKLLDMVPTQVEVPEVPQAFSTGIVEAMMTSPSTGSNTKAWDYVNRFYNIQAWIPHNMVMVNKRAFDALPKDTQQVILEAAKAATERGQAMSKQVNKNKKQMLQDHGMQVLEPGDELMAGFHEAGKELTQQWLKKAGKTGQDVVKAYRESLAD